MSFAAAYFGGRKQEWDALNGGDPANQSDTSAWSGLLARAAAAVGDEAAYWRLLGRQADGMPDPAVAADLDVDNLIVYMLIHYWGQARDWPGHNWYAARRRTGGGGWVFFAWDVELSMRELHGDNSHEGGPGQLFYLLGGHADFRARVAAWTRRLCGPGGALHPDACERRWTELVEEVAPALPAEFARWADRETLDAWHTRQTQITDHYLPQRTTILLTQLAARGLITLDPDGLPEEP